MANPLARVVMNNVSQKSGKVAKRSSAVNNSGKPANLGRKEKQLLSDLLNDKSYDKSTYGRSSKVSSNNASTMKTLSSLAPKGSGVTDKSRSGLKSLCTLDNVSVGRPNKSSNTSRNTNAVNALNLDDLVKGKGQASSIKRTAKPSSNESSGGMTTLGDLTKAKTKNRKPKDDNKKQATNNNYVKSSVINGLDAYVPTVTLESIGKKGSSL